MHNQLNDFPILESHSSAIAKLNDLYNIKRDPLDDKWILFNESIAKSLSDLYAHFLCLDQILQKNYSDKSKKINASKYLSFYFDFIVSKPSNTIFTETQKKSSQDFYPIFAISSELALKDLTVYVKEAPPNTDFMQDPIFGYKLQKVFHRTFAFYDFIYHKEEGVFTKFSYSKKTFTEYRKGLERLLKIEEESVGDIKTFRKHIGRSIIYNINTTINNTFPEAVESLKHSDVFKSFIQKSLAEKEQTNSFLRLEIFSYIMANKLWKADKIYQKKYEYENGEKNKKDDIEYIKKTKEYISKYLSSINSFYEKEITEQELYIEIDKIDKIYVHDYIAELFLPIISKESLCTTQAPVPTGKFLIENNDSDRGKSVFDVIGKYAINNNEYEKFKFYRVIAKAEANEVSSVIDALYSSIRKIINNGNQNVHYMGILRSGSFLAHALNILKYFDEDSDNNQISESLLTHPFLSIVPRYLFNRENVDKKTQHKVVYIDEAIKSGYGVTVSHLYRKKILIREGYDVSEKDFVITVVDFIDYKNKINRMIDNYKCEKYGARLIQNPLNYYSLFQCEREWDKKGYILKLKQRNITISCEFKWLDFLKNLSLPDNLASYAIDGEKYNLTKIISNSFLLFGVGKFFAEKLYEIKNKTDFVFYAGSIEGKLLIDVTVFIYKVLHQKDRSITFYINGKTFDRKYNENVQLLFFDLSYISGRTCEQVYELDVSDELRKQKSHFDSIFVIYKNSNNDQNIYSIF